MPGARPRRRPPPFPIPQVRTRQASSSRETRASEWRPFGWKVFLGPTTWRCAATIRVPRARVEIRGSPRTTVGHRFGHLHSGGVSVAQDVLAYVPEGSTRTRLAMEVAPSARSPAPRFARLPDNPKGPGRSSQPGAGPPPPAHIRFGRGSCRRAPSPFPTPRSALNFDDVPVGTDREFY